MVKLIPMTKAEFQAYLEEDIRRYAEANVEAGYWHPSEALEKSRQVHEQLLPDGLATKNQHLFSIVDEASDKKVGILWVNINIEAPIPSAFIYDFLIHEDQRGEGYGTQAMKSLEDWLQQKNIETVSLHIFANNKPALKLYEKTGFEITSLDMRKVLPK